MTLVLKQGKKENNDFLRFKRWGLTAVALWFGFASLAAAQQTDSSPQKHLVVTIDAQQTATPVSKYEYGMFIEHIGSLIYRSLWSEMLDDRKFYFPMTSKSDDHPASQATGSRGAQLRKWRPVGPDEAVTMDKDQPFVGDQSPKIELTPATPHGIQQSGLALTKGKTYTGHVYLRGTVGSKVKVALIWGEGKNDRQIVPIAGLTNAYKEQNFDLNITGERLSGNATQWQLTGKELDAANHAGQSPQVEIKAISMGNDPKTITVAPISVNIYRFPVTE